jgi:hypothetical protein
MKIHFRRTGGFGGMILSNDLQIEELSDDDAQELISRMEDADFFNLPERMQASGRGVDRFQYQITAETEQASHSVSVDESAMPESLEPLIKKLTRLARSR